MMISDTAERILDTAHALMAERGYAAFSYADIADVVNIRKASIHHHFPTKEALVTAVLKRHRQKLKASIEALNGHMPDPFARLTAYVQHWQHCIGDKTDPICIAALLGAELPTLPDEVKAEVQRHFQDLRNWLCVTLEAGVSAKTIKLQQSAAIEAETLLALMHGAMISARAYGDSKVFALITSSALHRLSPKRAQKLNV